MTKKILAPLTAVAAVALMAVSLLASGSLASAAVNGISAAPTTVDRGDTVVLTIDADETVAGAGNVRVIATGGDFTECLQADAATDCTLLDAVVLEVDRNNDIDFTVDDTADDVGTLFVTWEAPDTAGVVTFTVIQGSSTKTATVTVRGAADALEFRIMRDDSPSTSACVGTDAEVIQSTTASAGDDTGYLCTVVRDASGTRLASQPVIYSTTAGTVAPITDTTGDTGQVADNSTIVAGSSGTAGTTATVTASSGGRTATDTIIFGGDPASCTVTVDPTSVSVGGSSVVSVDVKDSTGGPIPDNQTVNVAQANPGSGANAAILDGSPETTGGKATTTAIAAIPGAIALGASTTTGNVSCTTSLMATGTVIPPTGGEGDGSLTAPTFGTGNVGSAVFAGGTIEQLATQVTAAGGTSVWAQNPANGNWVRYNILATGATAFVNNAFNQAFAGGFAGATAVFVVK